MLSRTVLAATLLVSFLPVYSAEEESGEALERILEQDSTLRNSIKRITDRMEREDVRLLEAQRKHKEEIAKLKVDMIKTYETAAKRYVRKGKAKNAEFLQKQAEAIKKQEDASAALANLQTGGKVSIKSYTYDPKTATGETGQFSYVDAEMKLLTDGQTPTVWQKADNGCVGWRRASTPKIHLTVKGVPKGLRIYALGRDSGGDVRCPSAITVRAKDGTVLGMAAAIPDKTGWIQVVFNKKPTGSLLIVELTPLGAFTIVSEIQVYNNKPKPTEQEQNALPPEQKPRTPTRRR